MPGALLLCLMLAFIIYGSLFPFHFDWGAGGQGPWKTLIAGWSARPGRGDFLANILFYIPFGLFLNWLMPGRAQSVFNLAICTLLACALSVAMECLQYFDPGRVTAALDVYSNTLGGLYGRTRSTMVAGKGCSPKSKHHV